LQLRDVDNQGDVQLARRQVRAEEYLTHEKRQIGNFAQAFSHLALVNAADMLAGGHPPAI